MNILLNIFKFFLDNIILTKGFLYFLIIYISFSYFLIGYIMRSTEKYFSDKDGDKEIHEKYNMFRRLDSDKWNKNNLLIGALLFSWIKLSGVLFSVVLCYVSLKIITRGKNILDYRNKELQGKIIFWSSLSAKIFMFFLGIFIKEKHVDYDYSKFLGNGYKKDHKPAVYISNHTSWIDIILYLDKLGAGFISSIHVKSFPLIGFIATTMGCIYVDRNDKTNRGNSLNLVNQKINDINSDQDNTKLIIFPEGTTSNTTSILPFKKGAFSTRLPVKPFVITFEVKNKISLAMDVIDMLIHVFVVLCIPFHNIELYNLPVFSPNDYFFNEYNKNGKEDWELYAETMREIMCDVSGLQMAKGSWESKKLYLDFLRKAKI